MHPIEQQLRKVIEKAEAFDPDSRNKFYLAARKTIQKLPDEKAEQALLHGVGVTVTFDDLRHLPHCGRQI